MNRVDKLINKLKKVADPGSYRGIHIEIGSDNVSVVISTKLHNPAASSDKWGGNESRISLRETANTLEEALEKVWGAYVGQHKKNIELTTIMLKNLEENEIKGFDTEDLIND